MNRILTYCLLFLIMCLHACEDVYYADIDKQENLLVADARIIAGLDDNVVRLSMSQGFNDDDADLSVIKGARVTISDSNDKEYNLPEIRDGLFHVDFQVDSTLEYQIRIDYAGQKYASGFERVQRVPKLDSVYGIPETKVYEIEGDNSNEFRESNGLQMYGDILSENVSPYYRFSFRRVMQYTYVVQVGEEEITHFAWQSSFPLDIYNLASPSPYSESKQIVKHPLSFVPQSGYAGSEAIFQGWILILYQHALSESAHDFYKDLNSQLGSDGKLFDPLYVQARNNLKCETDPDRLVLGNFEISTMKEYRYYIKYLNEDLGYLIKPITYFYQIPLNGDESSYPPDFWETPGKEYPDEE